MELKKIISITLVLSFVLSLIPFFNTNSNVYAMGSSYSRTYTKMVNYNYGERKTSDFKWFLINQGSILLFLCFMEPLRRVLVIRSIELILWIL